MRFKFAVAALAATFVASSPAFAQAVPTSVTDSADAEAHGRVLSTHSLVNAAPLNFGTVVANATNAGTVTIAASSAGGATADSTGYVTIVGAGTTAARFDGLAAPGETVLLSLNKSGTNALTLANAAGDTMTGTLSLDSDGATRTADVNSGGFTAYVGGTFNIAAKQKNGYYVGTFTLTADYQ